MANAELPCWDMYEVGWLQETDLPKLPSLTERGWPSKYRRSRNRAAQYPGINQFHLGRQSLAMSHA
jgi:hypothetical protein